MDIEKARQRFAGTGYVESPKPAAIANVKEDLIVDLDVRADLRAGREPFSQIMAAQQSVRADGVLRLRAIFEPVPLYAALGRFGFTNWTKKLADDDWEVWFYRGSAAVAQPEHAQPTQASDAASDAVVLDVRGLEPPEPMQRTLEALERLPAGRSLLQLNSRVPQFLLPLLEARGFKYAIVSEKPGEVAGLISRMEEVETVSNAPQHDVARELDVRVIPPREKHPTIFKTFDALEPGTAFTLVNDHDPFPLRYQFEAERTNQFTWQYLEQGPVVWKVLISKVAS